MPRTARSLPRRIYLPPEAMLQAEIDVALFGHRQRLATHFRLHDGHADNVVLTTTAASAGEKPDTRPYFAGESIARAPDLVLSEKQRTATQSFVIQPKATPARNLRNWMSHAFIVSRGAKMDMITRVPSQVIGSAHTRQTRL